MKRDSLIAAVRSCVLHFFKRLLSLVDMWRSLSGLTSRSLSGLTSRSLSRLTSRVLLSGPSPPVGGGEIHAQSGCRLVVGLGNPGMEGSRHSVGMAVLGALAHRLGATDRWRGDKHVSGEVVVSEIHDVHVVLLRPKLLMNINGVSVAKAVTKYNIKPEDILLVHDELDKPLGKIAIKHGGSARGHNGVRSCIDCLQTDVMTRLRVGIGRPAGKTPVDRHVLGRFSEEEREVLSSVLDRSVDLLLSQLAQQHSQSPPPPAGGRPATRQRKERGSPAAQTSNACGSV
ncbi:probable peptidyl-tRNA hydrolase [Lampris incognitus]|uniref:probable peptidyl-tRNA hydrolase n=1 Tax=Lampris incognitus TaxID=2546036 RepID=UPI0024B61DCC|nr:probable peptidyl-tRNA hydrolase [Lampris incognitus]XP_056148352.1 probable peptidyl-tRNA hydrolase [Lampris incognitus]